MPEETVPTQFEATYPDKANKKPILLIVAVVILALAVVTLSFFLMQASQKSQTAMSQMQAELVAMQSAVEESTAMLEGSVPPYLYTTTDSDENGFPVEQIWEVDRASGERTLVHEGGYHIFAVPQIAYDGTIIVSVVGYNENPWLNVRRMVLETSEVTEIEYPVEMHRRMTFLSPDQRKVAVVSDRSGVEGPVTLHILDVNSGNLLLQEELADGEFFASEYDALDGAGVVDMVWNGSSECVTSLIYTDSEEGERRYSDVGTYCIK